MEAARHRADTEPLRLSSSWGAAVCVFIVWDILLSLGLKLGFQRWGSPYWAGHWWVVVLVAAAVLVVAEGSWSLQQLRAERAEEALGSREDNALDERLVPDV